MSKHCTTFREGDKIYCMSGRQVIHCGYSYEYKDALADLAERMGINTSSIRHYDKPMEMTIAEDLYRKIFSNGAGLSGAVDKLGKALEELEDKLFPKGTGSGRFDVVAVSEHPRWLEQIARLVVHDAALCQLRTKVKGGNERTLTFAPLPERAARDAADFPYLVVGKRTVKTGTYYPPDEDGSGGLEDSKAHVLLRVQNPSDYPAYGTLELLAADCVHSKELKLAEKLRQES